MGKKIFELMEECLLSILKQPKEIIESKEGLFVGTRSDNKIYGIEFRITHLNIGIDEE